LQLCWRYQERLVTLLNQPVNTASDLIKRVELEILAHIDTYLQEEDITILALQRNPAYGFLPSL
jgi:hypothetical protein